MHTNGCGTRWKTANCSGINTFTINMIDVKYIIRDWWLMVYNERSIVVLSAESSALNIRRS